MTITIPPAALEAAARTIADLSCPPELFGQCEAAGGCVCREFARAACLAMLENWPGSEYVYRQPHRRAVSYSKPAIILPLTENSNDKG